MEPSLRLVHTKRQEDPVLLQPYLYLIEEQPESKRREQTEMGMVGPMTPHKAKLAQERKPTQRNKKPPTKPQQLTQWNPNLMRALMPTAGCEQCRAKLFTKMMAGI